MGEHLHLATVAAALALAACNSGGGNDAGGNAASSSEAGGVTGGNAPTAAAEGGVTGSNAPAAAGPAAAGGAASSIPCPFANGGSREWRAWVNAMPGPGAQRTLIVVGEVRIGSDGYGGQLTPTVQDRRKPPIQHFELNLVEKSGAKKGWQEVRGQIRPAGSYDSVVIDCHGEVLETISPVPEAQ